MSDDPKDSSKPNDTNKKDSKKNVDNPNQQNLEKESQRDSVKTSDSTVTVIKQAEKKKEQSNQQSATDSGKNALAESNVKTESKTVEQQTENTENAKMTVPKMDAPNTTAPEKDSAKTQAPIFDNKSMPKMEAPRRSKKAPVVSIIAIILALLTLGGVGWGAYQQFLMQQSWQELQTKINDQVNQQLANNQENTKLAQTSLTTANNNQQLIGQQQQLIRQLRESLTTTQERLKDLSGRRNQDWLLAEAEYLIKLAEFKITLEGDKRTSIGLLKAADEKIKDIGDNSLIELRQSIAQDISNLQLVVAPDISGIAVQIDAISNQIASLNLVALEFQPIEKKMEPTQDENQPMTWEVFYTSFLDDFVTIKDHSEPVKPLMTLEQRGLLNANIQLALQQAQVAVLRTEQGLYLTNIDNAIEWINTFFKKDELATNLLSELKNLRDTRITLDLPKSLDSRKQIESINQDRLYQWLDGTQPIEADSELQP